MAWKRRSHRVFVLDTVKVPGSHRELAKHNLRVIGTATLKRFQDTVPHVFNETSADGFSRVLYIAKDSKAGPVLEDKLFTAKRDKIGKKKFKMFTTFYDEGEKWQEKLGISPIFERATQTYPSTPSGIAEKSRISRPSVKITGKTPRLR